jgi:hypothetical protein
MVALEEDSRLQEGCSSTQDYQGQGRVKTMAKIIQGEAQIQETTNGHE